jgi:hypothetical protein
MTARLRPGALLPLSTSQDSGRVLSRGLSAQNIQNSNSNGADCWLARLPDLPLPLSTAKLALRASSLPYSGHQMDDRYTHPLPFPTLSHLIPTSKTSLQPYYLTCLFVDSYIYSSVNQRLNTPRRVAMQTFKRSTHVSFSFPTPPSPLPDSQPARATMTLESPISPSYLNSSSFSYSTLCACPLRATAAAYCRP